MPPPLDLKYGYFNQMDLALPQACSALSGFMSVRPSVRGKKGRDSKDPARDMQGLPRPLISYKHDIY